ncbi:MAG TPA: GDSL-type esterase/lipase family protein [Bryobacteraceae bacterium]|jgi:lysophospholipase L1-like esterase
MLLLLIAGGALSAQTPAVLLSTPEVNRLCTRSLQLMDAGGVAIADLARAAAPVVENVRQACLQLQRVPASGQPTYALMMNLRAYLTLADAVPKPFPFPDAARQQFAELRDISTRLDTHFRALLDEKDNLLRNPDPYGLARYAEANRKLGAPRPGKPRVVFLGDSITGEWRLNEYFTDRDFVNRGIENQTTGQMLGRMKADVIDLHPEALVIQGGDFDLSRDVPLLAIEDNYAMLADLAGANRIKVIFASVPPVSDYHTDVNPSYERTKSIQLAYVRALNEWLQSFCSQRKYTYVNFYAALADEHGMLGQDLSDDGLQPNSKGYRLMAPLALQAVDKALGPPPAPSAPPPPAKGKPKGRKEASK